MIVYFTGTGNSKYVSFMLSKCLEDRILNSIPYTRENKGAEIDSEKPVVFVCPTYSWQIPHVFRDFILKSTFKGNSDAYFVMTCGSDIANAEKFNKVLCGNKGLSYKGTLEVIMPENYIAMFSAPDRNEAVDIIKKADSVILKGAELIKENKPFPPCPLTAGDNLKSNVINKLFYPMFVKASPYRVKDSCISCGKCTNICPLANIKLVKGKPQWGDNCTQCMACMNYCPVGAIEYGNKSKGKIRYVCPL